MAKFCGTCEIAGIIHELQNNCSLKTSTSPLPLVYKIINSTLVCMRQSITQKFDYGCGIACFAFALGISYKKAEEMVGQEQATSTRFWVKDLTKALNKAGYPYVSKHVKPHIQKLIYQEGVIVLIRRSKIYPSGHYLIRHDGMWMDSWINLPKNKDISRARSGFRKRLPGKSMYAILPASQNCK